MKALDILVRFHVIDYMIRSRHIIATYATIAATLGCSQTQARCYRKQLKALGAKFTTEVQSPGGWIYDEPWDLWQALYTYCEAQDILSALKAGDAALDRLEILEAEDGV